MILEKLLSVLEARGLTLALGLDGRPVIRGPAAEVTPALRACLADFRDDLLAMLPPPTGFRVVLLAEGAGKEGPAEVLAYCGTGEGPAVARMHAQGKPGRVVAAEWYGKAGRPEGWVRYLWVDGRAADGPRT